MSSKNASELSPHSEPIASSNDKRSILQQWLALLSVSLGAFALVTAEFLPVGVLNEVATDLNISAGSAGLMVTFPGIIAAISAVLVPVLIGNLDRRKLLLALMSTLVISNGILAFSSNFTWLMIGRLILGIGIGGFWGAAIALATRLAPRGVDAAKSSSIIMTGVTLATVLGVPLGTWLSGHYGWRTAFAICGVIAMVVLIFQFFTLPSLKPSQKIRIKDLPALLTVKHARVGVIAVLAMGLGHFCAFTYVAPFLKNEAQFDLSTISSLLLLYGAAGFVGNWFAGYLAAKNIRHSLIFIGSLIGLSIVLLPVLGTGLMGAAILIGVWGSAFGAFPAVANIWMLITAPDEFERGMPLFVGVFQVAIAVGSYFGGLIVDGFGVNALLVIATGLLAIGIVVAYHFGRGMKGISIELCNNKTISALE